MTHTMDYELNGHKALVTGSSRGIGSAIALELAGAGADVIVHCSAPSEKADNICRQIIELGRKSEVVCSDLTNIDEVKTLCDKIRDVDILVLNASTQIKKSWESISPEEMITQLSSNCIASVMLSQAVVPYMKEKGFGRIIAIGSVQELKPNPKMLSYSMSKCAQNGMVKSLAMQLAEYGITVNDVAPGVVVTDRNLEALSDIEYAKKVIASIPAGFYGQKEDPIGLIRVLCSEYGRYITGQTIFVDGGKSL